MGCRCGSAQKNGAVAAFLGAENPPKVLICDGSVRPSSRRCVLQRFLTTRAKLQSGLAPLMALKSASSLRSTALMRPSSALGSGTAPLDVEPSPSAILHVERYSGRQYVVRQVRARRSGTRLGS